MSDSSLDHRAVARDRVDGLVTDGDRYGLAPDVSRKIAERVREESTDPHGRFDEPRAKARFQEFAQRVARLGGRLRRDPGKGPAVRDAHENADAFGDLAPGKGPTLVELEQRRTAGPQHGMRPSEGTALPHQQEVEALRNGGGANASKLDAAAVGNRSTGSASTTDVASAPLFSGDLEWEEPADDEPADQLAVARELVARAAVALGAAPAPVRMDHDARTRTEAHGATALMSHGAILLHPERFDPRSAGAFETVAHEQVHVLQLSVDASASEGDPELEAQAIAAQIASGRKPDRPVARLTTAEAADSGKPATPPTPQKIRGLLEEFLAYFETDVWKAVREHLSAVQLPAPHPRLEWSNESAFVEKLSRQLADWIEFRPLGQFDELLYPTNVVTALGAHVPTTKIWAPQVGIAVAHALHIAVVSSIHRLAPRYLQVADSLGASGENSVRFDALVTSMPIDRYVAAALCAPNAVSVEPLDAKAAKAAKGKSVGLKNVTLTFEGVRDPALWNWVRASPSDATAEDVAAAIWRVTDGHGDPSASFAAFQLAAAPPLFGVPKRFAITNANFKQYAPAEALAGHDSVDTQLLQVANSKSTDEAALHEQVPHAANAAAPERAAVLASLGDCRLQLDFLSTALAPWKLATSISPALAFVRRREAELPTADAKALTQWFGVVEGQKDRLTRIAGNVHGLIVAAPNLGVTSPASEQAGPLREILELLAVAGGTSHLAHASEAKLLQAQQQQAGLSVRALQATEASMMGGIRDVHQQAGDTRYTGGLSSDALALQGRSRQLQAQMLNGQTVDAEELDEVSMKSEEIALESRMYGALAALAELNQSARESLKGDAAAIAAVFSSDARGLPRATKRIFDAISPIRNGLKSTRDQMDEEEKLGQSPERKRQQRALRRQELVRAQTNFAKLAQDKELDAFFKNAVEVINNQQFRIAVVKVAAMIGISIVGGAVAGLAARAVGGMTMQATGVKVLADLGVAVTRVAVDTTISAAGTAAVQGTSFADAWKENVLVSLSSSAVFGSIQRHAVKQAELEGKIATTWAQASKRGKAWIVAKELRSLTAHTLWGAAMGAVAGQLVTGKAHPPPATIREWALQGVSVAIGKHVSQRISARSKMYKALAQQFEDAGRGLAIAADKLKALAHDVISSKKPAKALALLEQHDQFLRREIEAVDRALAKAQTEGKPTDQLQAARENLRLAADAAGSEGMLDTRFALLGMEELVPGALWKGTHKQIEEAIAHAKKGGQKVKHSRDADSGRWHLKIGERALQVQEVASTARTVDVERVMLAGDDEALRAAMKLVPPDPEALDVVLHGTVDDFYVWINGEKKAIDHRALTTYIKKSGAKYKRIRLLACESGKHPKGAAQHLANKLGVLVEAPTDKLFIHPDGTLTIGPRADRNTGTFEIFRPTKSETRYRKAKEPSERARRDTTSKTSVRLGSADESGPLPHRESELRAWATESLPNAEAESLLQSTSGQLVKQCVAANVSARTARDILSVGQQLIERTMAAGVTITQLASLQRSVPGSVFQDMIVAADGTPSKVRRLAKIADNYQLGLDTVQETTMDNKRNADGNTKTLVLDTNTLIAIEQLTTGKQMTPDKDLSSFGDLLPLRKDAINAIRAARGLDELDTATKLPLALEQIVGDADLRITPLSGAEAVQKPQDVHRKMKGVAPNRTDPKYAPVIESLRNAQVGGAKGAMDRGIIADTIFSAVAGETPVFITQDPKLLVSVAKFATHPRDFTPPADHPLQALRARYPEGRFTVTIEDRTLEIVFSHPKKAG